MTPEIEAYWARVVEELRYKTRVQLSIKYGFAKSPIRGWCMMLAPENDYRRFMDCPIGEASLYLMRNRKDRGTKCTRFATPT